MTFLNPIYLWSLLGIIVPIAIHLWSRRKVVKIKVGSTKLLRESEPRQTSTIRPNELWLLFLRILTILLLTLILSEPQIEKSVTKSSLLYVVEPVLISSDEMGNLLDGIPEDAIRVMEKEFPLIADYDSKNRNSIPNYWQLAQQINTLPADSMVVFTKGFLSGIKGRRPIMANHINWLVLNSDDESNQIVGAKKKGDSLELLSIFSSPDKLWFEKKKLVATSLEVKYNATNDSLQLNESTIPLVTEKPINVLLVYIDSLERETQYLEAGYRAVSKYVGRPITIETVKEDDSINLELYDVSVWLGVEPTEGFEKTRLIFKPDPLAIELIEPGNAKNEYFLTQSLNGEDITAKHLTEKLLVLLNLHKDLDEKIQFADKRVVPVEELTPAVIEKQGTVQQASLVDISMWLWALLLLILVTERIIAKYRKQ